MFSHGWIYLNLKNIFTPPESKFCCFPVENAQSWEDILGWSWGLMLLLFDFFCVWCAILILTFTNLSLIENSQLGYTQNYWFYKSRVYCIHSVVYLFTKKETPPNDVHFAVVNYSSSGNSPLETSKYYWSDCKFYSMVLYLNFIPSAYFYLAFWIEKEIWYSDEFSKLTTLTYIVK
jgi:hypothetical protein